MLSVPEFQREQLVYLQMNFINRPKIKCYFSIAFEFLSWVVAVLVQPALDTISNSLMYIAMHVNCHGFELHLAIVKNRCRLSCYQDHQPI